MNIASPTSALGGNILLEAGTNEVEILMFRVGDSDFGVNVAKVREVLEPSTVTAMPHSHPAVEGMVRIRENVVLTINLAHYLFGTSEVSKPRPTDRLLLLEFNAQMLAFRVHGVRRIFRVSWNSTNPLPSMGGLKVPVTSLVLLEGRLVQLIDFESIAATLGVSGRQSSREGTAQEKVELSKSPVIFAEDSGMISEMIKDELERVGLTDAKGFSDGEQAWNYLTRLADCVAPGELPAHVACVITDVEMPRMDGLSLTRRIRQHSKLKDLPVVIFSSLVSRDNEKKGHQVGATAQVPKPQYDQLGKTLVKLLRGDRS